VRVALRFLAESVENPANRERIADLAVLLGASCTAITDGRLIAVENTPQAREVYGRQPLRGHATLALGHERRGLPRAMLAAAAAVAGWYVLRGSGPQARAAQPARRHPAVLLSGDDHVEVGSSLRSAAAFGLREVFLDDRGAQWFDGPHGQRREARAAARRHKNPLRVRRAPPAFTAGFDEIVVVSPWGPGRALNRQPLTRGRRQAVVIGAAAQQLEAFPADVIGAAAAQLKAFPADRVRVATLGLRESARVPLRLTASITLAEIARQAGRPAARAPAPRRPAYEREVKLAADGELLILDPATLLEY
jgi:hypothetical protein